MKRREFLGTAAVAAASVGTLTRAFGAEAKAPDSAKPLDLVALYGGEAVAMYERGIAEMGGIGRFVKKGDVVVVKPNIGWDKTPETGANTNPELVGAVVADCMKAGAKEVLCFDHTCGPGNDWDSRYKMSGIRDAVEKAGGKMVAGNTESMYVDQDIPKGVSLKHAKVHPLTKQCDVFINMPVLKHHSGAKITAALKNYMGCIWDRRWWHQNDMPQCIADYSTWQKTTLTIVDAYRVMLTDGPRGGDLSSVITAKYQIISTDIVAADTAAVQIFASVAKQNGKGEAYELADIKYLQPAEKLGVGTTDLSKLNMKRVSLA